MHNPVLNELEQARLAAGITQAELAGRAGLHRMAVQRIEAGTSDPRLSTLQALARALGMELMLVPAALRTELEGFVRSGGKLLGQAPGTDAPSSVVDELVGGNMPRKK
jgi:transcriptional regulator with XRE-family HTH domain